MHKPLQLKSDYLNLLLDRASNRSLAFSEKVYDMLLGMRGRDLRLLRLIGNSPGLSIGELVYQSAVEKTLVSKAVTSLSERGLVKRHIGEADARQIRLSLTRQGISLVKRGEAIGKKLEASYESWLTADEIRTLRRILTKILEAEEATRDKRDGYLRQLAKEHRSVA